MKEPNMSLAIIVAGQSNALGYLNNSPAPYVVRPSIVIWNNNTWEPMNPGVNTGTPTNPYAWGPEVGFATKWWLNHGDEVLYIVKSAKGSTGLDLDPYAQDWSPASTNELFDITKDKIAASSIGNATVLWAQGEQDAANELAANAYAQNLEDLKEAAFNEWGAVNWINAKDSSPLPYSSIIQDAQGAQAVETESFKKQPDNLHYNADGQFDLGLGFYEHWENGWFF